MLRIHPEEITQDIMRVGTIGLPQYMNYEDKRYRKDGS